MDHASTMRSAYERINAGDIDGFGALISDDFVEHEGAPDQPPTKAGTLAFFRELLVSFPDMRMDVDDLIVSGDKAVARVTARGTHKGEFMGKPHEGHGFLGYDNTKKRYVTVWIENMGTGIMSAEGDYDPAKKQLTLAGEYADPISGGICPMLAAHRNGGRINLASFARSWDRYTDADHPRPATERELRTLVALLESSLVDELPAPARTPRPSPSSRPRIPFRIRRLRKPRDAEAPEPVSVA